MYRVMLRCLTGTHRFVGGSHPYWEAETHTITWCHEPTAEAAAATVADLYAGRSRHLIAAWAEPA